MIAASPPRPCHRCGPQRTHLEYARVHDLPWPTVEVSCLECQDADHDGVGFVRLGSWASGRDLEEALSEWDDEQAERAA